MLSPGFSKQMSSRTDPNKQRETMTGIHEERAALGNQAPAPTIISSNELKTTTQSNPLLYLNGASPARSREIIKAR